MMEKIGKYNIVKELGSGATSKVFLGTDPFTSREVAIKLFHSDALKHLESGKLYKKLFFNEASLAGKLSHPHIVSIFDAVVDEDFSYLVMEYVDGQTLEKFGEVDHLLELDQIVEIIYKCCKALEYAQRNGVIHRDIKPANILIRGNSDIKISDFGAAIIAHSLHTTQVSGIGSPAYMSPQQVKEQDLTHQTDIYSLGVVMYKLLTGRLPYAAANNYAMIYQIIHAEASPPSTYRPEVPPELDAIVMRAIAKELNMRFQTWDEFAEALSEAFGFINQASGTISDTEKFDVLRGLTFFKSFTDVELWEVLRLTAWKKFDQAETLIREGEVGKSFFIIAEGEAKVTRQGKLLNLLKTGDCFGEMAYSAKRQFKRVTSVAAVSAVTLIEVNSDTLLQASEACRQRFNEAFLEILVERLAMADTRLSQLLAERG